MTHFADKLTKMISQTNNPTVMGLDPVLDYVPESLRLQFTQDHDNPSAAAAEVIWAFNQKLIDAVSDIIPAIKPQFAYYEMYGLDGIRTLYRTIEYARSKGMCVIADAKRNDIGSTASAYAKSILGKTKLTDGREYSMIDADAVTLNAYLGWDGIAPFAEYLDQGKGMFILVHTSNPSSVEVQELKLEDGRYMYEAMADHVSNWGRSTVGQSGYSPVGAVVGATWPEQATRLRALMPHTFFLVPGYGAQGGDASTVAACFDKKGGGAIVNASRSLMCAYKKREDLKSDQFAQATREEAIRMRNELNNVRFKK